MKKKLTRPWSVRWYGSTSVEDAERSDIAGGGKVEVMFGDPWSWESREGLGLFQLPDDVEAKDWSPQLMGLASGSFMEGWCPDLTKWTDVQAAAGRRLLSKFIWEKRLPIGTVFERWQDVCTKFKF
jgi:hypothetical protein